MEYVIHLIATLLDPSRKAKNMDTEKAEEKLQGQEAEGTERRGGCFYISGGPGTGKTTTIMKAIRMVEESREELPEFRVISVAKVRPARRRPTSRCGKVLVIRRVTDLIHNVRDCLGHLDNMFLSDDKI